MNTNTNINTNIISNKKLIVKYNKRIVGYLAELKNKTIAFQYADSWLDNGFTISPISLPLSSDIYINNKTNFDGLYGVFWDTLPDGWGQLLMKRKCAQLGVDYNAFSPLQKLALINSNGLGALEYEPSESLKVTSTSYSLDELAAMIGSFLKSESFDDLDALYLIGGSSGGARPKAHINLDDAEWIVKFPLLSDPLDCGIHEYKLNQLAQECGIHTANFRLFPSQSHTGYFGSQRFDRNGEQKIHTISLCGLLEVSHHLPILDYGHLFYIIKNYSVNKDDLYEAFRRMCFNVYAGNKDDHGKNFSFIYDESQGGYCLSPAYDLTATPFKFEHEMTIQHQGNPTDSDLMGLAEQFHLSTSICLDILDNIKSHF